MQVEIDGIKPVRTGPPGLQRERALFASIMRNTDVMLAYLDPDFTFLWVNDAYAQGACKSPAELIGQNHFVLYPHAENEAIFRRVRDTMLPVFHKDKPFEHPGQPERGTTYWDWSLVPDIDPRGAVVGLVFSLRDTTAHVRAEQAIRETEMRFAAMANAAPMLIWMAGPGARCNWFNRQWLEFTGRTLDEALAAGRCGSVHRDDAARCRSAYEDAFARQAPFKTEYRLLAVSGEYRWITEQAAPRYGADGRFLGFIGACADITEQKRAEETLRAAKLEAEGANNAKSRFLAAASHDLRQPLSALSLYASVLKAHVSPVGSTILAKVEDCVGSLSGLITDLLDLSKLEAGAVTPSPVDLPLDAAIAQLASVHRPAARLKGLELRCRPCGLTVRTDPVLFKRILGNLMDNAIRYTERGGVLVACRRHAGGIRVEVWDTGVGIPADKTSEIFEEFTRLARDGEQHGSGLGLAIVARTARLLGHDHHVASRPGRGSVFSISLPTGAHAPRPAPAPRPAAPRPLHIAVAEDDPLVREALTRALQDAGHRIVAAPCGRTLRAALGDQVPDLVIADHRLMDGETGLDVILALRTTAPDFLPAILVTGDTDPELVRSIAGRDIEVLHKPLDPGTLEAAVDTATRVHRSRVVRPE